MEFRLTYRGELRPSWLKNKAEKQKIRRKFHPQIRDLWDRVIVANNTPGQARWNPLKSPIRDGDVSVVEDKFGFKYAPIVSQAYGWSAVAELKILFLRASEPGQLINHGGDIDNRIKILFDTLRMPQNQQELPEGDLPLEGETPFCVLLQDDALVTGYSVSTDRLLAAPSINHVELVIQVKIRATKRTMFNSSLW